MFTNDIRAKSTVPRRDIRRNMSASVAGKTVRARVRSRVSTRIETNLLAIESKLAARLRRDKRRDVQREKEEKEKKGGKERILFRFDSECRKREIESVKKLEATDYPRNHRESILLTTRFARCNKAEWGKKIGRDLNLARRHPITRRISELVNDRFNICDAIRYRRGGNVTSSPRARQTRGRN